MSAAGAIPFAGDAMVAAGTHARAAALPLRTPAEVAVAARALEDAGRRVLRLEVGEPDFPTPPHVVEAAVAALRAGHTRYAPAEGLAPLRAAAARELSRRGVPAHEARVAVAPGAKLLLACVLQAALAPGDEALVPDPGYPSYAGAVARAGARAVTYPVRADGGVRADEVAARITARTRVLVLNAPHNPTGGVLDASALAELAGLARRHDLLVVSDEIYARLTFERAHASIAALPGMAARTALVDGCSKAYSMTGWRLAYGLLPAPLVPGVTRLLGETASCTPPFVQLAGVAALTGPQDDVARRVAELRARRDALVGSLAAAGVPCATPAGGLYVFPHVAPLLPDGARGVSRLVHALLHEEGIACVPGDAFGPGGAGHVRLALTAPAAELARAGAALGARLRSGERSS